MAMRVFICVMLLIGSAMPSLGAQATPRIAETQKQTETRTKALDALFVDLKRARNERDAKRIEEKIWSAWHNSGDHSIDLLLTWASDAMRNSNFATAFDLLDQVVLKAPDYAEGWNRRATLHFMTNNYAKSMADIERVLELEPRHFGALAGMASIFRSSEQNKLALKAYQQILSVYPMNRMAQDAVQELLEELADTTL